MARPESVLEIPEIMGIGCPTGAYRQAPLLT
jgi:hypothetical protein